MKNRLLKVFVTFDRKTVIRAVLLGFVFFFILMLLTHAKTGAFGRHRVISSGDKNTMHNEPSPTTYEEPHKEGKEGSPKPDSRLVAAIIFSLIAVLLIGSGLIVVWFGLVFLAVIFDEPKAAQFRALFPHINGPFVMFGTAFLLTAGFSTELGELVKMAFGFGVHLIGY